MRLHGIVLSAGKRESVFEDMICFAKPLRDVAALVAKMKTYIAVVMNDVGAAPAIAGIFTAFEVFMHQRGAFF
jgi:hypothetical protein